MKTRLLKQLRCEAHKVYGIKGCLEITDGTSVYVVGLRNFSNKEDIASYELEDARYRLHEMRNKYCINRVAEIRSRFNIENKYRRF